MSVCERESDCVWERVSVCERERVCVCSTSLPSSDVRNASENAVHASTCRGVWVRERVSVRVCERERKRERE